MQQFTIENSHTGLALVIGILLSVLLAIPVRAQTDLRVTSPQPESGAPGTTVRIYGTGFNATASANTVSFGGVEAVVDSAQSTVLYAKVPSGPSGPVEISVTTGGTTAAAADLFTVVTEGSGSFAEIGADLKGVESASVDWGDYDSDGDLDLAVAGWDGSVRTTSIYQNEGEGKFTQVGAGLTGVNEGSVAWGDFDSDGDLDLALAGYDWNGQTTRIYRNDGGGEFTQLGAGLTAVGGASLAWGDYDADGDRDLAVVGTDEAKIYQNEGEGKFTQVGAGLTGVDEGSVAWGDFDSDGDLDLALAGQDADGNLTTSIYQNKGDGQFTQVGADLTGVWRASLAWGDYDSDGDLDLAVTGQDKDYQQTAKLYRNEGDGTFEPVGAGIAGVYDGSVVWGDYDSDSDLDLAVAGTVDLNPTTRIYRNEGDGQFTAIRAGLTGVTSASLAWGDYDGDGDLDLTVAGQDANYNSTTKIYENGADAPTPSSPIGLTASASSQQIQLEWRSGEDSSLDGYNVYRSTSSFGDISGMTPVNGGDLVTGTSFTDKGLTNGQKYYYRVTAVKNGRESSPSNQASATPTDAVLSITSLRPQSGAVESQVRIYGAGFSTTASENTVTFGNVEATVDSARSTVLYAQVPSGASGPVEVSVATGGKTAKAADLFTVVTGGSGSFSGIEAGLTGVVAASVAWGDYDSDGDLDLAVAGEKIDGNLMTKIYQNDGGGSFSIVGAGLMGVQSGSLDWGDFDADGDLDLVVTGFNSGDEPTATLYENEGEGSFSAVGVGLTGVHGSSVDWGDYDSDGDLDLVLAGETANNAPTMKIYDNEGNGKFSAIGASLTGVMQASVAWGDYNGDGALDLAVGGYDGSSHMLVRKIYRNEGRGTFESVEAELGGGDYSGLISKTSVAWGDFDGDEDLDLAVVGQNTDGDPTTKIYRNDGGGNFTAIRAGLTGVMAGSVTWGDFNADSQIDLAVTGDSLSGNYNRHPTTKIYRNEGNGSFAAVEKSPTGTVWGSLASGDYNGDGVLDLVLTGDANDHSSGGELTRIYRNERGGEIDAPAAPATLTAAAGDKKIRLEWSPGGEGSPEGYNVYRSTSSFEDISGMTPVNSSDLVTGTSFTEKGLTNGQKYYYRVTAVKNGTESKPSNEASATPTPKQVSSPLWVKYNDSGAVEDTVTKAKDGAPIAMQVETSGYLPGATLIAEVYEGDPVNDDNRAQRELTVQENGLARARWTPRHEGDGVGGGKPDFYFLVKKKKSPFLKVSAAPDVRIVGSRLKIAGKDASQKASQSKAQLAARSRIKKASPSEAESVGGDAYYFSGGEAIPLQVSTDRIYLRTTSATKATDVLPEGLSVSTKDRAAPPTVGEGETAHLVEVTAQRTTQEVKQIARSLRGRQGVTTASPVYRSGEDPLIALGKVIAWFDPSASQEQIQSALEEVGLKIVERKDWAENLFYLRPIGRQGPLEAANALYRYPDLRYAHPDFAHSTSGKANLRKNQAAGGAQERLDQGTPDDEYFLDQWYLGVTHTSAAWSVTRGTPEVTIAVVDDAVDVNHEDLKPNLVRQSRWRDTSGDDVDNNPEPEVDTSAHGTAVAGIAAAAGDNGKGVTGVCPKCTLLPVRVGPKYHSSDVAEGIVWAARHGADVINLSLSWKNPVDYQRHAILYATEQGRDGAGSVVIASSGNDDRSSLIYPASYPSVISVGASGGNGGRAPYSNYGSSLDLIAPGGAQDDGIFTTDAISVAGYDNTPTSTTQDGKYVRGFHGTSASAPVVAGISGLILSVAPGLSPGQLQALLQNSAQDGVGTSDGWDVETGAGIADAYAAVQMTQEGAYTNDTQISIVNDGSVEADVTVGSSAAWLSLETTSFSLPAGGQKVIGATVDHSQVNSQTSGTIEVNPGGGGESPGLSVSVAPGSNKPPQFAAPQVERLVIEPGTESCTTISGQDPEGESIAYSMSGNSFSSGVNFGSTIRSINLSPQTGKLCLAVSEKLPDRALFSNLMISDGHSNGVTTLPLKFGVPSVVSTASQSATVSSNGTANFAETGTEINFSGVSGKDTVVVKKFAVAPEDTSGISEGTVLENRIVAEAGESLSFESAEVRFVADSLKGVEDPANVTIYKRPDPGSGSFSSLATKVDENGTPSDPSDDRIYTTVSSLSEFAFVEGVSRRDRFSTQRQITTGADGANSVYATDLDGDGDPDVLSASIYDDKIAWYENQGDGSFSDQKVITTRVDGASAVYARDLDGDGDKDVLSASVFDDKIAWYENQGDGSFSDQKVITTRADRASSVYARDLDGDSDADIVSASAEDDKIAWHENEGGGSFSSQRTITTNADGAQSIHVADLDGDGAKDVLSASDKDDKIAWYENQGGTFSEQKVITTNADFAVSVYSRDLDGDGDPDVLSASVYDDKIAWYENQGDGSFSNQQVITTDAAGAMSVYAQDLNGDSAPDVLSASEDDDKIAWYENEGGGSFSAQRIITTSADEAQSVYARDLAGDSDPDILSASQSDDKIAWYENKGGTDQQTLAITSLRPKSGAPGTQVRIYGRGFDPASESNTVKFGGVQATVDSVGNSAIYVRVPSGTKGPVEVSVRAGGMRATTAGLFTVVTGGSESFPEVGAGLKGVTAASVDWGDYDSDGDLDLAVAGEDADASKTARIYRNERNGQFSQVGAGLTGVTFASLAWGDYDSDGDLDLAVAGWAANEGQTTRIYRNEGDGSFIEIGAGLTGVTAASLAWGDYDLDGDLDLAVAGGSANSNPTTKIYRNEGGGKFAPIGAGLTGVREASVAWGDYDSDGDLDLAVAGEDSGGSPTTKIYQNEGGGQFTPIGAGLTRVLFASLAWGDYDSDGDLDLAVAGQDPNLTSTTRIYRNEGGGRFSAVRAGLMGVDLGSLAWGDLDADGDLDLAVGGFGPSNSRTTRIYRNEGGGQFTPIGAGLTGVWQSSLAWGDYDSDGDLDLAVVGKNNGGSPTTKVYRNEEGAGELSYVNAKENGGTASVTQSTWKGSPENMIDGDHSTQWQVEGNPDEIVATFELDEVARVTKDTLDIDTGGNRSVSEYEVYARNDASQSWTLVKTVDASINDDTGGIEGHSFSPPIEGKQFKLIITEHTAPRLCRSSCDVPIVEYQLFGQMPAKGPTARYTATVDSAGRWDFGKTGTDIRFFGPDGSGRVTVEKFGSPPSNSRGISEENVSSYRFEIGAASGLSFDSTEVRFDVSTLAGVGNAENVVVYRRPKVGSGAFTRLPTTYDMAKNELVARAESFSEFVLASNTEPLPVELISFDAKIDGDNVRLNWETASETNNSGFRVQRKQGSASGGEGWQTIGRVEGQGTTTKPTSYQFTDENLPYEADALTYRLKQIDIDGSFSFSKKVTVQREVQEVQLLDIYPNPASRHVTLRYAVPKRQEVRISLYDVLGRLVKTVTNGRREGRHRVQVQTSSLSSGIYFLRLRTENVTKTRRLTVVR